MSEFSSTSFGNYVNKSIDYTEEKRLQNLYNNITFGDYTPTFSGQVNVTAASGFVTNYTKIGDVVTVVGRFEVQPVTGTVGGTDSQMVFDLPISSDLANVYDLNGTHNCGTVSGIGGSINAETTVNKAQVRWLDKDGTHRFHNFTLSYKLI